MLYLLFLPTDAIEELKNPTLPDYTPTTANERYLAKNIGTWSSISDVDVFLSRFTHANDYKDGDVELALGNHVTIQDGTYNSVWVIAGFDMEYNQTSADGNKYDNGLGICMIPVTQVGIASWNKENITEYGYIASTMHTSTLPTVVTNLQNILGSHIVNRNVLLSSSVNNFTSNSYNWTTAYATLMSAGQMTGTFATYNNKYDDGEANYKLPVFNFMEYKTASNFWVRSISGYTLGYSRNAWYVGANGTFNGNNVRTELGIRPLIYLR